MEIPSKRPEHVDYSSSEREVNEIEDFELEGEEESLTEGLRPSEETIRVGENLLTQEIKEGMIKFYAKVFDEKLKKEEKEGIPPRASSKVKAVHVRKFFKENPEERNRIESFSEEVKEEYYKIIDLAEIKTGLSESDMEMQTPFLLYDYLRGRYDKVNREIGRLDNSEARSTKEAEKDSIFNALKDLASKLSERSVEEGALRRMGEGREEYIEDRMLRPENIETAKQRMKEMIMEKEWNNLGENERNNYVNFDDFCNRRVEEVRAKLGSLGSGLPDESIYSILRRYKVTDISIDKGFFGSVKGARFGARKVTTEDFNDFINREATIFDGSAREMAIEKHNERLKKEEEEKIMKRAFKRMTPEDIRNACNKIREEKMNKFWKKVAGDLNRKESMEEYEEEGVDVPGFMDSFFYKKYTGNLERDISKMLSVLKNKRIIHDNFLDEKFFLEALQRVNPKMFREKEYKKNYKKKEWMHSLAFTVLETVVNEVNDFSEITDNIREIVDELSEDDKEKVKDLVLFYRNEKEHKLYRAHKAIWDLEKLRKNEKLEGVMVNDKKHFFNVLKAENIIEKGGSLGKEDDFYKFLGEMISTGIIDEDYKDHLQDEKKFLVFAVEMISLVEKKQI